MRFAIEETFEVPRTSMRIILKWISKTEYKDIDLHLISDKLHCQILVNTVLPLRFLQKVENFLTS